MRPFLYSDVRDELMSKKPLLLLDRATLPVC